MEERERGEVEVGLREKERLNFKFYSYEEEDRICVV